MLSVRISTFCCSSCGWKSFRAKKTASSSRRFMCHWLWDSSYSPEAGIPSHTTPQPWVDASVVIIWDHLTHLGCVRASMWPRCANIPKSTPFTGLEIPAIAAAGACVIIPDVIPLNPPPWVRAVSEIPSTEQSCLAWKAQGRQLAATRSRERRDSSPRDLTRGRLSSHAISWEAGSHPPRDLARGGLS